MIKKLFIDVETTGLDAKRSDIVQLSTIVEYDDIFEAFDIKFKPSKNSVIEEKALEKMGVRSEELYKYKYSSNEAYILFKKFLNKHIDSYDSEDKFFVIGYNTKFDFDFLREFFIKNDDFYIGSYLKNQYIDVLQMIYILSFYGKLSLKNYRLETVCEEFKIELEKAHDSLADIVATKQLFDLLHIRYFSKGFLA